MGQANKKSSTETLHEIATPTPTSRSVLREVAVAIDPPPDGAVGIRELLDRLDFMADASFFSSSVSMNDLQPAPSNSSSGWNIFEFTNPHVFAGPIDITAWSCVDLQLILSQMLRIRKTNTAIAGLTRPWTYSVPEFASEALIAGVSRNVSPYDQIIGSHQLLQNSLSSPNDVFSSIETISGMQRKIRDISDAASQTEELWNTAEVVATNIINDQRSNNPILICNIDAKEIENYSAQKTLNSFHDRKLPMLFICERVLHSSDKDYAPHDGECNAAKFADEQEMEWAIADGNDVVAIANASSSLIDRIRKHHGVGILEAAIFHQENDPGISTSISRLKEAMITRGDINQAGFEIFESLEQQIINTAMTNVGAEKTE